jgi:hypothetical protein
MHDHLVGYLCGALEAEEITLVERTLAGDQEVCRQLQVLRLAFVCLECDREDCQPPDGLAARLCEKIRALRN